jgi:hypothetical protein
MEVCIVRLAALVVVRGCGQVVPPSSRTVSRQSRLRLRLLRHPDRLSTRGGSQEWLGEKSAQGGEFVTNREGTSVRVDHRIDTFLRIVINVARDERVGKLMHRRHRHFPRFPVSVVHLKRVLTENQVVSSASPRQDGAAMLLERGVRCGYDLVALMGVALVAGSWNAVCPPAAMAAPQGRFVADCGEGRYYLISPDESNLKVSESGEREYGVRYYVPSPDGERVAFGDAYGTWLARMGGGRVSPLGLRDSSIRRVVQRFAESYVEVHNTADRDRS